MSDINTVETQNLFLNEQFKTEIGGLGVRSGIKILNSSIKIQDALGIIQIDCIKVNQGSTIRGDEHTLKSTCFQLHADSSQLQHFTFKSKTSTGDWS